MGKQEGAKKQASQKSSETAEKAQAASFVLSISIVTVQNDIMLCFHNDSLFIC